MRYIKVKCILKEALDGRPVTWLSNRTGIPAQTLYRYIDGDRKPNVEDAMAIAHAFGKSVEEIWVKEVNDDTVLE